jgi:hypothetical protein
MEALEVEHLTPAQKAHRQFNHVSARVDMLKRLIASRQATGVDFEALWKQLAEAEAEKKELQERLAKMGRLKILSRA